MGAKVKDAPKFVELSKAYLKGTDIRADSYEGADLSTPSGVIRFILAGNTQPDEFKATEKGEGWKEYHNDFHASYSWSAILSDWFMKVAPALEVGSDLEVAADGDAWQLEVMEDGMAA